MNNSNLRHSTLSVAALPKQGEIRTTQLLEYTNGIFQGQMSGYPLKKNGLGVFSFDNGDFYFGEWENDQLQGEGILFFAFGGFVHGYFEKSKLHGPAFLKFSNGEIYEGYWNNGLIDGEAYNYFVDENLWLKCIYSKGKFINLLEEGEGRAPSNVLANLSEMRSISDKHKTPENPRVKILDFKDGQQFLGAANKNKTCGLGILRRLDGKCDIGFCDDGKFVDIGRINLKDGGLYDGLLKNGKFNNRGVYYNPKDKSWFYGHFENGECKRISKQGQGKYPLQIVEQIRAQHHKKSNRYVDQVVAPHIFYVPTGYNRNEKQRKEIEWQPQKIEQMREKTFSNKKSPKLVRSLYVHEQVFKDYDEINERQKMRMIQSEKAMTASPNSKLYQHYLQKSGNTEQDENTMKKSANKRDGEKDRKASPIQNQMYPNQTYNRGRQISPFNKSDSKNNQYHSPYKTPEQMRQLMGSQFQSQSLNNSKKNTQKGQYVPQPLQSSKIPADPNQNYINVQDSYDMNIEGIPYEKEERQKKSKVSELQSNKLPSKQNNDQESKYILIDQNPTQVQSFSSPTFNQLGNEQQQLFHQQQQQPLHQQQQYKHPQQINQSNYSIDRDPQYEKTLSEKKFQSLESGNNQGEQQFQYSNQIDFDSKNPMLSKGLSSNALSNSTREPQIQVRKNTFGEEIISDFPEQRQFKSNSMYNQSSHPNEVIGYSLSPTVYSTQNEQPFQSEYQTQKTQPKDIYSQTISSFNNPAEQQFQAQQSQINKRPLSQSLHSGLQQNVQNEFQNQKMQSETKLSQQISSSQSIDKNPKKLRLSQYIANNVEEPIKQLVQKAIETDNNQEFISKYRNVLFENDPKSSFSDYQDLVSARNKIILNKIEQNKLISIEQAASHQDDLISFQTSIIGLQDQYISKQKRSKSLMASFQEGNLHSPVVSGVDGQSQYESTYRTNIDSQRDNKFFNQQIQQLGNNPNFNSHNPTGFNMGNQNIRYSSQPNLQKLNLNSQLPQEQHNISQNYPPLSGKSNYSQQNYGHQASIQSHVSQSSQQQNVLDTLQSVRGPNSNYNQFKEPQMHYQSTSPSQQQFTQSPSTQAEQKQQRDVQQSHVKDPQNLISQQGLIKRDGSPLTPKQGIIKDASTPRRGVSPKSVRFSQEIQNQQAYTQHTSENEDVYEDHKQNTTKNTEITFQQQKNKDNLPQLVLPQSPNQQQNQLNEFEQIANFMPDTPQKINPQLNKVKDQIHHQASNISSNSNISNPKQLIRQVESFFSKQSDEQAQIDPKARDFIAKLRNNSPESQQILQKFSSLPYEQRQEYIEKQITRQAESFISYENQNNPNDYSKRNQQSQMKNLQHLHSRSSSLSNEDRGNNNNNQDNSQYISQNNTFQMSGNDSKPPINRFREVYSTIISPKNTNEFSQNMQAINQGSQLSQQNSQGEAFQRTNMHQGSIQNQQEILRQSPRQKKSEFYLNKNNQDIIDSTDLQYSSQLPQRTPANTITFNPNNTQIISQQGIYYSPDTKQINQGESQLKAQLNTPIDKQGSQAMSQTSPGLQNNLSANESCQYSQSNLNYSQSPEQIRLTTNDQQNIYSNNNSFRQSIASNNQSNQRLISFQQQFDQQNTNEQSMNQSNLLDKNSNSRNQFDQTLPDEVCEDFENINIGKVTERNSEEKQNQFNEQQANQSFIGENIRVIDRSSYQSTPDRQPSTNYSQNQRLQQNPNMQQSQNQFNNEQAQRYGYQEQSKLFQTPDTQEQYYEEKKELTQSANSTKQNQYPQRQPENSQFQSQGEQLNFDRDFYNSNQLQNYDQQNIQQQSSPYSSQKIRDSQSLQIISQKEQQLINERKIQPQHTQFSDDKINQSISQSDNNYPNQKHLNQSQSGIQDHNEPSQFKSKNVQIKQSDDKGQLDDIQSQYEQQKFNPNQRQHNQAQSGILNSQKIQVSQTDDKSQFEDIQSPNNQQKFNPNQRQLNQSQSGIQNNNELSQFKSQNIQIKQSDDKGQFDDIQNPYDQQKLASSSSNQINKDQQQQSAERKDQSIRSPKSQYMDNQGQVFYDQNEQPQQLDSPNRDKSQYQSQSQERQSSIHQTQQPNQNTNQGIDQTIIKDQQNHPSSQNLNTGSSQILSQQDNSNYHQIPDSEKNFAIQNSSENFQTINIQNQRSASHNQSQSQHSPSPRVSEKSQIQSQSQQQQQYVQNNLDRESSRQFEKIQENINQNIQRSSPFNQNKDGSQFIDQGQNQDFNQEKQTSIQRQNENLSDSKYSNQPQQYSSNKKQDNMIQANQEQDEEQYELQKQGSQHQSQYETPQSDVSKKSLQQNSSKRDTSPKNISQSQSNQSVYQSQQKDQDANQEQGDEQYELQKQGSQLQSQYQTPQSELSKKSLQQNSSKRDTSPKNISQSQNNESIYQVQDQKLSQANQQQNEEQQYELQKQGSQHQQQYQTPQYELSKKSLQQNSSYRDTSPKNISQQQNNESIYQSQEKDQESSQYLQKKGQQSGQQSPINYTDQNLKQNENLQSSDLRRSVQNQEYNQQSPSRSQHQHDSRKHSQQELSPQRIAKNNEADISYSQKSRPPSEANYQLQQGDSQFQSPQSEQRKVQLNDQSQSQFNITQQSPYQQSFNPSLQKFNSPGYDQEYSQNLSNTPYISHQTNQLTSAVLEGQQRQQSNQGEMQLSQKQHFTPEQQHQFVELKDNNNSNDNQYYSASVNSSPNRQKQSSNKMSNLNDQNDKKSNQNEDNYQQQQVYSQSSQRAQASFQQDIYSDQQLQQENNLSSSSQRQNIIQNDINQSPISSNFQQKQQGLSPYNEERQQQQNYQQIQDNQKSFGSPQIYSSQSMNQQQQQTISPHSKQNISPKHFDNNNIGMQQIQSNTDKNLSSSQKSNVSQQHHQQSFEQQYQSPVQNQLNLKSQELSPNVVSLQNQSSQSLQKSPSVREQQISSQNQTQTQNNQERAYQQVEGQDVRYKEDEQFQQERQIFKQQSSKNLQQDKNQTSVSLNQQSPSKESKGQMTYNQEKSNQLDQQDQQADESDDNLYYDNQPVNKQSNEKLSHSLSKSPESVNKIPENNQKQQAYEGGNETPKKNEDIQNQIERVINKQQPYNLQKSPQSQHEQNSTSQRQNEDSQNQFERVINKQQPYNLQKSPQQQNEQNSAYQRQDQQSTDIQKLPQNFRNEIESQAQHGFLNNQSNEENSNLQNQQSQINLSPSKTQKGIQQKSSNTITPQNESNAQENLNISQINNSKGQMINNQEKSNQLDQQDQQVDESDDNLYYDIQPVNKQSNEKQSHSLHKSPVSKNSIPQNNQKLYTYEGGNETPKKNEDIQNQIERAINKQQPYNLEKSPQSQHEQNSTSQTQNEDNQNQFERVINKQQPYNLQQSPQSQVEQNSTIQRQNEQSPNIQKLSQNFRNEIESEAQQRFLNNQQNEESSNLQNQQTQQSQINLSPSKSQKGIQQKSSNTISPQNQSSAQEGLISSQSNEKYQSPQTRQSEQSIQQKQQQGTGQFSVNQQITNSPYYGNLNQPFEQEQPNSLLKNQVSPYTTDNLNQSVGQPQESNQQQYHSYKSEPWQQQGDAKAQLSPQVTNQNIQYYSQEQQEAIKKRNVQSPYSSQEQYPKGQEQQEAIKQRNVSSPYSYQEQDQQERVIKSQKISQPSSEQFSKSQELNKKSYQAEIQQQDNNYQESPIQKQQGQQSISNQYVSQASRESPNKHISQQNVETPQRVGNQSQKSPSNNERVSHSPEDFKQQLNQTNQSQFNLQEDQTTNFRPSSSKQLNKSQDTFQQSQQISSERYNIQNSQIQQSSIREALIGSSKNLKDDFIQESQRQSRQSVSPVHTPRSQNLAKQVDPSIGASASKHLPDKEYSSVVIREDVQTVPLNQSIKKSQEEFIKSPNKTLYKKVGSFQSPPHSPHINPNMKSSNTPISQINQPLSSRSQMRSSNIYSSLKKGVSQDGNQIQLSGEQNQQELFANPLYNIQSPIQLITGINPINFQGSAQKNAESFDGEKDIYNFQKKKLSQSNLQGNLNLIPNVHSSHQSQGQLSQSQTFNQLASSNIYASQRASSFDISPYNKPNLAAQSQENPPIAFEQYQKMHQKQQSLRQSQDRIPDLIQKKESSQEQGSSSPIYYQTLSSNESKNSRQIIQKQLQNLRQSQNFDNNKPQNEDSPQVNQDNNLIQNQMYQQPTYAQRSRQSSEGNVLSQTIQKKGYISPVNVSRRQSQEELVKSESNNKNQQTSSFNISEQFQSNIPSQQDQRFQTTYNNSYSNIPNLAYKNSSESKQIQQNQRKFSNPILQTEEIPRPNFSNLPEYLQSPQQKPGQFSGKKLNSEKNLGSSSRRQSQEYLSSSQTKSQVQPPYAVDNDFNEVKNQQRPPSFSNSDFTYQSQNNNQAKNNFYSSNQGKFDPTKSYESNYNQSIDQQQQQNQQQIQSMTTKTKISPNVSGLFSNNTKSINDMQFDFQQGTQFNLPSNLPSFQPILSPLSNSQGNFTQQRQQYNPFSQQTLLPTSPLFFDQQQQQIEGDLQQKRQVPYFQSQKSRENPIQSSFKSQEQYEFSASHKTESPHNMQVSSQQNKIIEPYSVDSQSQFNSNPFSGQQTYQKYQSRQNSNDQSRGNKIQQKDDLYTDKQSQLYISGNKQDQIPFNYSVQVSESIDKYPYSSNAVRSSNIKSPRMDDNYSQQSLRDSRNQFEKKEQQVQGINLSNQSEQKDKNISNLPYGQQSSSSQYQGYYIPKKMEMPVTDILNEKSSEQLSRQSQDESFRKIIPQRQEEEKKQNNQSGEYEILYEENQSQNQENQYLKEKTKQYSFEQQQPESVNLSQEKYRVQQQQQNYGLNNQSYELDITKPDLSKQNQQLQNNQQSQYSQQQQGRSPYLEIDCKPQGQSQLQKSTDVSFQARENLQSQSQEDYINQLEKQNQNYISQSKPGNREAFVQSPNLNQVQNQIQDKQQQKDYYVSNQAIIPSYDKNITSKQETVHLSNYPPLNQFDLTTNQKQAIGEQNQLQNLEEQIKYTIFQQQNAQENNLDPKQKQQINPQILEKQANQVSQYQSDNLQNLSSQQYSKGINNSYSEYYNQQEINNPNLQTKYEQTYKQSGQSIPGEQRINQMTYPQSYQTNIKSLTEEGKNVYENNRYQDRTQSQGINIALQNLDKVVEQDNSQSQIQNKQNIPEQYYQQDINQLNNSSIKNTPQIISENQSNTSNQIPGQQSFSNQSRPNLSPDYRQSQNNKSTSFQVQDPLNRSAYNKSIEILDKSIQQVTSSQEKKDLAGQIDQQQISQIYNQSNRYQDRNTAQTQGISFGPYHLDKVVEQDISQNQFQVRQSIPGQDYQQEINQLNNLSIKNTPQIVNDNQSNASNQIPGLQSFSNQSRPNLSPDYRQSQNNLSTSFQAQDPLNRSAYNKSVEDKSTQQVTNSYEKREDLTDQISQNNRYQDRNTGQAQGINQPIQNLDKKVEQDNSQNQFQNRQPLLGQYYQQDINQLNNSSIKNTPQIINENQSNTSNQIPGLQSFSYQSRPNLSPDNRLSQNNLSTSFQVQDPLNRSAYNKSIEIVDKSLQQATSSQEEKDLTDKVNQQQINQIYQSQGYNQPYFSTNTDEQGITKQNYLINIPSDLNKNEQQDLRRSKSPNKLDEGQNIFGENSSQGNYSIPKSYQKQSSAYNNKSLVINPQITTNAFNEGSFGAPQYQNNQSISSSYQSSPPNKQQGSINQSQDNSSVNQLKYIIPLNSEDAKNREKILFNQNNNQTVEYYSAGSVNQQPSVYAENQQILDNSLRSTSSPQKNIQNQLSQDNQSQRQQSLPSHQSKQTHQELINRPLNQQISYNQVIKEGLQQNDLNSRKDEQSINEAQQRINTDSWSVDQNYQGLQAPKMINSQSSQSNNRYTTPMPTAQFNSQSFDEFSETNRKPDQKINNDNISFSQLGNSNQKNERRQSPQKSNNQDSLNILNEKEHGSITNTQQISIPSQSSQKEIQDAQELPDEFRKQNKYQYHNIGLTPLPNISNNSQNKLNSQQGFNSFSMDNKSLNQQNPLDDSYRTLSQNGREPQSSSLFNPLISTNHKNQNNKNKTHDNTSQWYSQNDGSNYLTFQSPQQNQSSSSVNQQQQKEQNDFIMKPSKNAQIFQRVSEFPNMQQNTSYLVKGFEDDQILNQNIQQNQTQNLQKQNDSMKNSFVESKIRASDIDKGKLQNQGQSPLPKQNLYYSGPQNNSINNEDEVNYRTMISQGSVSMSTQGQSAQKQYQSQQKQGNLSQNQSFNNESPDKNIRRINYTNATQPNQIKERIDNIRNIESKIKQLSENIMTAVNESQQQIKMGEQSQDSVKEENKDQVPENFEETTFRNQDFKESYKKSKILQKQTYPNEPMQNRGNQSRYNQDVEGSMVYDNAKYSHRHSPYSQMYGHSDNNSTTYIPFSSPNQISPLIFPNDSNQFSLYPISQNSNYISQVQSQKTKSAPLVPGDHRYHSQPHQMQNIHLSNSQSIPNQIPQAGGQYQRQNAQIQQTPQQNQSHIYSPIKLQQSVSASPYRQQVLIRTPVSQHASPLQQSYQIPVQTRQMVQSTSPYGNNQKKALSPIQSSHSAFSNNQNTPIRLVQKEVTYKTQSPIIISDHQQRSISANRLATEVLNQSINNLNQTNISQGVSPLRNPQQDDSFVMKQSKAFNLTQSIVSPVPGTGKSIIISPIRDNYMYHSLAVSRQIPLSPNTHPLSSSIGNGNSPSVSKTPLEFIKFYTPQKQQVFRSERLHTASPEKNNNLKEIEKVQQKSKARTFLSCCKNDNTDEGEIEIEQNQGNLLTLQQIKQQQMQQDKEKQEDSNCNIY